MRVQKKKNCSNIFHFFFSLFIWNESETQRMTVAFVFFGFFHFEFCFA